MVTKVREVLTGRPTISGFGLAWFSSLSSERFVFSIFTVLYIVVTSFSLPFSELSLVCNWLLTCLTNCCPSVLWHCWLGLTTCKIVSEMTYNVLSGTLNPTTLQCCQVEYDLENSKPDEIQLAGSDRIEQSAMPLSMAWYPPLTKESFILTVNDQVCY